MGIKLGSVIEVHENREEIPAGVYEIDRTDPDDLHAPFLGRQEDQVTTLWFRPTGKVHGYSLVDTSVIRE